MPEENKNVLDLTETNDGEKPLFKASVFTLVVVASEKKTSSNGNPMIVNTVEFASPDEIEVVKDGEVSKVKIAGISFRDNIVLTQKAAFRVKAWHKLLDLNVDRVVLDEIDCGRDYLGKGFLALVTAEAAPMVDPNGGEPIIDPETGEPITSVRYSISKYLKAAPKFDRDLAY